MATTGTAAAAQMPAHARRVSLRSPIVDALAIAPIAACAWGIFSHAFLNYDTLYALIWGRNLVHGQLPNYDVTLAPTPHPLAEVVGALASLAGTDAGYTIMLAIAMLAFGALVWGVFLLGRECFNWPVGALAAVVVATREPLLSFGMRAYVDIPFLALVVFAAVLEVRRPRRGLPVLLLLALAGLLRPEAWLLAAVYWIYMRPVLDHAGRARAGALVLSAPLIWLVSDLAITGNALHSLTATRDTAETLGRPRGILKVPTVMPRRLGEILRWVPLVGGTIGFFAALYYRRGRALVPAALAVLGGLAFVGLGVVGLSLLGRYLFGPAVMIAIFFGFAAFGWIDEQPGRARKRWRVAGVLLALVFVGSGIAHQTPRLDHTRDGIQLRGEMQNDLRDLARAPTVRAFVRTCSPIYVPNHRPVPILAWYLDRSPAQILSAQLERPTRGVFIGPANALVRDKFVLDPHDPKTFTVPSRPAGFDRVVVNRSWVLYERDCPIGK